MFLNVWFFINFLFLKKGVITTRISIPSDDKHVLYPNPGAAAFGGPGLHRLQRPCPRWKGKAGAELYSMRRSHQQLRHWLFPPQRTAGGGSLSLSILSSGEKCILGYAEPWRIRLMQPSNLGNESCICQANERAFELGQPCRGWMWHNRRKISALRGCGPWTETRRQ